MSPIFSLDSVSFVAGTTKILNEINWAIRHNENWAILGPNGAGKTTLLRIACGYEWPNAGGTVKRLGKELLDLRELRRSIGWISIRMISDVPPKESVRDTVVSGRFGQLGLKPFRSEPVSPSDYDLAERFLSELHCAELGHRSFGVLSQGEQQKVLIARARMARPLLIVLDEPCAGMDPAAREQFLASLARLINSSTIPGIVLVTHQLEEILPGFNKTLFLREGRVLRMGETSEVISETSIEELYGWPVALRQEYGRWWPMWKSAIA